MSREFYPRILPAGEQALVVEFGDAIDPAVNDRVVALARSLELRAINGVTETIASYRSLLVLFEPSRISARRLRFMLARRSRAALADRAGGSAGLLYDIPVCYGGAYGPDLPDVAAHCGVSPQEIVRRHSDVVYRVFMLGFMPGFPYLGGLDKALETPRLDTPRALIPAGSVGIGGRQTGVYPLDSPGGWRLIGRTPVRLYDPARSKPVLLQAGDRVRFIPISEEEYERADASCRAGSYEIIARAAEEGGAV
ncbi:MAG: 5-oxoprolinase subunit PxpB [Oscillospiraceae bacterium]|jgi:KipI family sensor histidine kinase inhibitor|nr:5-oxoprolinase subunit PxpB [Oscillospiraceae bacterium]